MESMETLLIGLIVIGLAIMAVGVVMNLRAKGRGDRSAGGPRQD